MHCGLVHFPTDYSISTPELAREAEQRGFESLWLAEHSHIPVSRVTPFPGGGELPKMYYDTLDPFVALAAAASVTTRIKLATGICLVVQRDPIHTAKEVASLDHFSGGRFLFGVGAGWNAEEMANHGTDARRRFSLMRERIEAMKAIWSQSKAEYHGKQVDFAPIFQWPKPLQKPHPPIHVGGGFPAAAHRAVRYGDGWVPVYGRGSSLPEQIAAFRKIAAEAGRDANALEVSIYACPADAAVVGTLRAAGADRVCLFVPSAPRDEVLALLDRHQQLAQAVG